jgi:hypothetical protein
MPFKKIKGAKEKSPTSCRLHVVKLLPTPPRNWASGY